MAIEQEPERETDPRTWKKPSEERREAEARGLVMEPIGDVEPSLKSSALKPTSPTMDAASNELVDAKIAASEARGDTKLAQAMGRIDLQFARIDTQFAEIRGDIRVIQISTAGLKGTIVVTGVAVFLGLLAAIIGVLAYGSGAFYNGTVIRDMISRPAVTQGK